MKQEQCTLMEVTLETGKTVQLYVPVFSETDLQDYLGRIFGRSKWHTCKEV